VSSFVRNAGDVVTFGFNSVGGFDSSGVLVFDQGLEQLVPARLMSDGNSMDNLIDQIQLSESEMSDILSGFGSDAPPPPPAQRPAASGGGDRSIPPNLDMVLDIRLTCTARLGRVDMPIGDILTLGPGSILEVGHLIDEPVELLVNDKLIARGDVVVVDEKFGLRITEIMSQVERIESLR
jgi:flagellar motor switch protein FliN